MPDGFTKYRKAVEAACTVRDELPVPGRGSLPLPDKSVLENIGLDADYLPGLDTLPWWGGDTARSVYGLVSSQVTCSIWTGQSIGCGMDR